MNTLSFLKWKINLERKRQEKNKFFLLDSRSPLTQSLRVGFKGLAYYPPDQKLRFEPKLYEYKEKTKIKVGDSSGKERLFLKWGEFRFRIGETRYVLQAYKSDYSQESLFIPFRDITNGKETYSAGRYIDIDSTKHTIDKGKWILDFNRAYNPFCAYSSVYSCPFVPPENWLKVAVRAGEKKYN